MDEQVCPVLTSSEQTSSVRLNKQENPLTSSTSSSSAVDGAWVVEAKGDDEERDVRNVLKIPLFLPNFSNLCFVILFRLPSLC